MEPLLPEAAEGGDACARPNEDAGLGGVLGQLETADTKGDRSRNQSSDTLGWTHTLGRGWGSGVQLGEVV